MYEKTGFPKYIFNFRTLRGKNKKQKQKQEEERYYELSR